MQIALRLYTDPGQLEVLINLKKVDGSYERVTCIVDTGSPVLFLPTTYLDIVEYRLSQRGHIQAKQAWVAAQIFDVVAAYITIYLEDLQGNMSQSFEVLAWFAETDKFLIGFGGLLERSILDVDMPKLKGNIELP